MENKKEVVMKNWSITQREVNLFTAPELINYRLQGNAYGHPNFNDGTFVITSSIQDIINCNTYKIVETRNTNYKIYSEDVSPEYEEMYNDAFTKLKMNHI